MERNCLFCETAIDKKKHGLVKFCSTNCRNKYYYQNKSDIQKFQQKSISSKSGNSDDEKIHQTMINENEYTRKNLQGSIDQEQFITKNIHERTGTLHESSRRILDNDIIRYLEENYKIKADLVESQLRHENSLKEIQDLKLKIIEFENELEEDEEFDEKGLIGMLNKIPDWLQPALGGILKSEKVQNFIIGLIPDQEKNQSSSVV